MTVKHEAIGTMEAKEKDLLWMNRVVSSYVKNFKPTNPELILFMTELRNSLKDNKCCEVERKILVLDLDETLLHTRRVNKDDKRIYKNKDIKPDFSFKVK